MATSPLTPTRNRILFAAILTSSTGFDFGITYDQQFSWYVVLADTLLSNVVLACACIVVCNTLRYYLPRKNRFFYIFLLCSATTGIWLAILNFGVKRLLTDDPAYYHFFETSLGLRFNIGFLATGFMALITLLWSQHEDQKEIELRKNDAEKLARDAELFKLRQQLQPHFLFNSLNSISALAGNPEKAREMIQQLSDFLRSTLKKEETQLVPLSEELQHLQLYLDIEKVRFGHRLQTVIEVTPEAKAAQLPPLLLQPIVENAIKFGLYDTVGEVTIVLQSRVQDGYLLMVAQNPFDPDTSHPQRGTGFGISSIKRRLYLLYNRNDLLATAVENNIFTTIVKIPQL